MRLKIRLLLLYTCVGIAVLAIVGSVLFVQVKNNRSADLEQEFQNQLMHLDFALTNLIEEAKSDVSQLSENEVVRATDDEDFTSFLTANESAFEYNIGETEQNIIDILNSYRTTHDYVNSVYMGRENGTFVRAQPRTPTQYDPRERPWYMLGKENPGQIMITEPYESVTTTDVNIGVVTALVGDDGEVYGVVGADITLNSLTDYMSGFNVGYQGNMLLTDENGTIVAFTDSEFLFENVEALLGDAAADMMSNDEEVTTVETETGSYYLYLYTSPELGWKLAVMAPVDMINGVIQGPVFIALFGLFIALALLSLLTFFGLNVSVINPLKRLSEVAMDIASSGDLSQKTGIVSKNEIGTLAASFDRMTDTLREKGEALSASEMRYRRLFEAARDGVLILDAETGLVVDVNPFLIELLGYSHEEFTGKTIWELGTLKDIVPNRDNFLELQRQGYVRYEDLPLETISGRRIEVEFISNAYLVGQKKVIQCNIRDITERKRTEKAAAAALRESEEKYREVVERANDGIIILQDAIIQYSNQRVSDIAGYEAKEIIGTSITNYIHPDELPKVLERYKQRMAGEHVPRIYDTVLVHKDGNSVHVELNAGVINYQGKPADLVIIRDITERKRAEAALRESEEQYRTFFSTSRDCVFITSKDGAWVDMNDAAVELFGYSSKDELKQVKIPDLYVKAEDRTRHIGAITKYGYTKDYPVDLRKKDGGVINTLITSAVRYDANGNAIGFMGTIRDITERKRAEQEIQFKGMLLDAAADSILVHDLSGRIVYANKVAEALRGYAGGELIGKDLHKLSTNEYAQMLNERIAEIKQKGEVIFESAHYHHDGSSFPIEIHARLIDINGEKLILRIGRDITERKQAEHQVEERLKELRAFYRLAELTEREGITLEELYQELANILPQSWQYPEITCCRIVVGNSEFRTKNFTESAWMQSAPVKVRGSVEGRIEVGYLEERPEDDEGPFMKEERLLIDTIAERIGRISERKRAEDELRETNEKLQVIFDSMGEALTVVDLDGNIVDANKETLRLHGFSTRDAIIGRKSSEMVAPVDRDRAVNDAIKALKSHYPSGRTEYKLMEANGREFDGEFNVAVIKDNKGKPAGFIGIARDISERKRAEEALRKSEEKYRTLTETTTDIVYAMDNMGNLTFIGPQVTRYDMDPKKMMGKPFFDFVHPEDREKLALDFERTLTTNQEFPSEFRVLDASVNAHWLEEVGKVQRDSSGTITGITGVIRDITERKQAEQALRESEKKFREMAELLPEVVYECDINGNITFANKVALEKFGYTGKDFDKGVTVQQFIAPADKKRAEENIGKVLRGTEKGPFEYNALRKDGSEFSTIVYSSAITRDGTPVGLRGIILDITERKKTEIDLLLYKIHLEELVKERTAELDKAKITAEQANKAKSDFLANMSHEIRTPLSTIIGFSELLYDETKGPVNDDQKKYLGYVTSSGQHLLSLINDILDLSKVEAGKMELLPTAFSISDLLKNSLSFIAEKAMKHNIKLRAEISADVSMIEADERKVKQIIYNLLSNSVKFTPDGGSVTIGAKLVKPNSAALPAKIRKGLPATEYVLISVKDTGIGIAKEDQAKLFTEFQQIEEPYSKKYEGTGLGLALSKKLVTLHGGEIWFESKGKGKGCTFYFILPLKTLPKA